MDMHRLMHGDWGINSYNRYSQIAARAVRQSLVEAERLKAEKRGTSTLKFQKWEDGTGGEQVLFNPAKIPQPPSS
ncbi:hypothetical protein FRB96_006261 [Tulasnella sp. 330]|nr:hypothetical protein FRB96_006261 [Tulasnella sp. 330]KAG8881222.1 hypothetical protein FRB97_009791 [Tulasnella sp. 331]KAG8890581.1 hypothetical protein FRB98_007135 [Tulasnella sp. 332]